MFYEGARFHEERYKRHGERLADMANLVRDGLQISVDQYDEAMKYIAGCKTTMAELVKQAPVIIPGSIIRSARRAPIKSSPAAFLRAGLFSATNRLYVALSCSLPPSRRAGRVQPRQRGPGSLSGVALSPCAAPLLRALPEWSHSVERIGLSPLYAGLPYS